MAQVIAKLFQNKKFQGYSSAQNKSTTKWHVARFTREDINLVLFKENCDKAILDSRSLHRVTLDDVLCEKCLKLKKSFKRPAICRGRCSKIGSCPGLGGNTNAVPKYKKVCNGNKNDKLVREMIFGACPLASAETTIKVHSLKSPHKLMLSSVFQFKRCRDDTKNTNFDSLDSFESEIFGDGLPRRSSENNLASMGSHGSSGPMDIITPREGYWGSDTTLNLSVSSSSYMPPLSSSPGAHSAASINSGSRLSIMRRMRHSFNRSLQYNNLQSEPSSLASSGGESDRGVPSRRRGARLGMAVIFSLDEFDDSRRNFEAFFFSHITIIEGHMLTLRAAIEQSSCEAKFDEFIMEAMEAFRQKVYDLYTTRPLERPVWLSLMASSSQRYRLCDVFVREFSLLIDRYDTKSTNYFVSSLLTGVLMYHLAWVPTVTPSGETHASYADKHSPKWPDMLAKTHPYNPLWAQLSDMYGAIGMPPRLARTIVTGKKMETVLKFLNVLSYFIRCSEIHETLDECYDEENVLCQIQSAVTAIDDLCVESMEKEAAACGSPSDFVLVDAPNDNLDLESVSDSGLVSQYTGHSKATRPQFIGINNTTLSGGSESGFTEPGKGAFAAVPSSSPADKVQDWLNTSQLNEGACIAEPQLLLSNPHTELTRSTTDSTLVNTLDSPCLSPLSSSRDMPCMPPCVGVLCAPDPIEARHECEVLARRSAISPIPELTDSQSSRDNMIKSSSDSGKSVFKRKDLVRLFSSEIDDMDYVFDGKPPALSRQVSGLSSVSQFDELFDGDDLDSYSAIIAKNQEHPGSGDVPEVPTPTNGRNMLNKVMKQAGFSSQTQSPIDSLDTTARPPLLRDNSVTSQPPEDVHESSRPRNLSVGKASSRCSTPQTIKGGDATPASDPRTRQISMCPTILSDQEEDCDPFSTYDELEMPRSKNVSKLADPAISTTNFGRQMLAGYSDHYLSDFVLHGTSDDDVHRKVQKDLVASEAHSVLEDRINEAVCVVADTERWCINICSSKREQPKPLAASDLVKNMVEATNTLAKLKMSPELILIHMEDRLQEMFFKSRMLSEYIKNQKSVDMDELNAMFGLAVTDIRFLLSVASTHSTVNVHGIY